MLSVDIPIVTESIVHFHSYILAVVINQEVFALVVVILLHGLRS